MSEVSWWADQKARALNQPERKSQSGLPRARKCTDTSRLAAHRQHPSTARRRRAESIVTLSVGPLTVYVSIDQDARTTPTPSADSPEPSTSKDPDRCHA